MIAAQPAPTALLLCNEGDLSFAQAFRFQYVIDKVDLELPGFVATPFAGWVLQTGADLELTELYDSKGQLFGLFFGVGAHHDGRAPAAAFGDGFDAKSPGARAEFEDRLSKMAGRFGVLTSFGKAALLYTDAAGLIGACFDGKSGRVGASPYLCSDGPSVPNPLYKSDSDVAFGLSHTAQDGVERLNPNHVLDLNTLKSKRFWPKADDAFEVTFDAWGETLDTFLAAARGVITSLAARHKTSLSLSGGLDSRMIFFAAGPEGRADIAQHYTHILRAINKLDAAIGRSLCATAGVVHETHSGRRQMHLGRLSVSEDDRAQAMSEARIAGGTPHAARPEIETGLYSLIDRDAVVLRGQQIPILRALFVDHIDARQADAPYFQAKLRRLLEYEPPSSKADKAMTKSIASYLKDIPDTARSKCSDLAFYETVNGPELAASFTGNHTSFYLSPFNSREMIRLMMSFPTALRWERHLFWAAFIRAAPEMAGIASLKFVKGRDRETEAEVAWRAGFIAAEALFYKMIFDEYAPDVPVPGYDIDVMKTKGHRDLP